MLSATYIDKVEWNGRWKHAINSQMNSLLCAAPAVAAAGGASETHISVNSLNSILIFVIE